VTAQVSAVPDLLYSDIEDDLRASVRALLADRSPWDRVLARTEGGEPTDQKLWRALAVDLGCAGLAVPERLGGAGASFREAAVVMEELGRTVSAVPFLGAAVMAPAALLACDDAELLADLSSGARLVAVAVPLTTAPGAPFTASVRAGAGGELTGEVTSVADALAADVLLVPAAGGLHAVDATAEGVTRTPVVSLDQTRQLCDLRFDGAPSRQVAAGEAADRAREAALTAGAALLASEQLGVAEWCLDTTVAYVKTRHQFGRPVGSFQALKHRLAELWVAVTQARAVARYAAVCLADGDPDTPVAVALAQAHCSAVAVLAAEECVQLHGGIGFTWEHPAHLYLKRAKSASLALGGPRAHVAALADLVDLPS
jgi:alkylation response protein AidB-like acyl-CoA dehydrogenase